MQPETRARTCHMLLDEIEPHSANLLGKHETVSPRLLDEIAYVALVGLLGVVPKTFKTECFEVGELTLSYQWSSSNKVGPRDIIGNGFISLSLLGSETDIDKNNKSLSDLIALWSFVRARSDAMLYWPSVHRDQWMRDTSERFKASPCTVKNLAANYPQIQRLFH